jgi:hypothetical protein
MRYELEMFGHLVADRASSCLTTRPHDLPELFKKFRADFADDPEWLAIVDGIEETAASFAGRELAERMGYRVKRGKAKRPRRKPLDVILTQASKAGNVTSVTVDGVELRFGGEHEGEQTNDLDKWMAKRHAN